LSVTDVLTPEQRRLNMSRIRGRDTKPEWIVRRGLHARGLRFRLHQKDLPGKPDLVFPKHRAVIFVHGCFWHGHGCHLSKMPSTRPDFWAAKIEANQDRDRRAVSKLEDDKWRILVIWECALRGVQKLERETLLTLADKFVRQVNAECEVQGTISSIGRDL
jgi:DNA mismatch endonuclease, patch repair protein